HTSSVRCGNGTLVLGNDSLDEIEDDVVVERLEGRERLMLCRHRLVAFPWLPLLAACAPSPAPSTVVEVAPPTPTSASVGAAASATPPETVATPLPFAPAPATTCDNDTSPPFDCTTLNLGQCSAAEYYACPRKVRVPEGMGFRPKI